MYDCKALNYSNLGNTVVILKYLRENPLAAGWSENNGGVNVFVFAPNF